MIPDPLSIHLHWQQYDSLQSPLALALQAVWCFRKDPACLVVTTWCHRKTNTVFWRVRGTLARTGKPFFPPTSQPGSAISSDVLQHDPNLHVNYGLALKYSDHETLRSSLVTSFRYHTDYLYILHVDLGSSCAPGI